MSEGFVVSDKNRRVVFIELLNGETTLDHIVKKNRMIRSAAERALADLTREGIASAGAAGLVKLTVEGERIAADLKRKNLLP